MSFAPTHGNHHHPYNRRSGGIPGASALSTNNGKVRTDFSGLFPPSSSTAAAGAAAVPRVRTRNNSQTQKPVTLMLGAGGDTYGRHGGLAAAAIDTWPSTELQFPVDEDQRDTYSCETREDKTLKSSQHSDWTLLEWSSGVNSAAPLNASSSLLNHTGYSSATAATKPSFE